MLIVDLPRANSNLFAGLLYRQSVFYSRAGKVTPRSDLENARRLGGVTLMHTP